MGRGRGGGDCSDADCLPRLPASELKAFCGWCTRRPRAGSELSRFPTSIVAVLRRVTAAEQEISSACVPGGAWHRRRFRLRPRRWKAEPTRTTLTRREAFHRAWTERGSGVEGVRLHDLRRAFATLQMKSGTNARVVSDLLGHATVAFTLQTCSHPDAEMATAAMAHVDRALGEGLAR